MSISLEMLCSMIKYRIAILFTGGFEEYSAEA